MKAEDFPLVADPNRQVKTLLFADPPLEYVADSASMWSGMGFDGFIRPDVIPGWQADVWATSGDARIVGHANPLLRTCRLMNRNLLRVDVTDNVISVPFTRHLPDWFDDEAWEGISDNFREDSRFARMAGFVGLALDLEYIEEVWGLHWEGYLSPGYPRHRLRDQARLRGYQIQQAMLSEFPNMVTLQLPETYSINGELAKDLFVGSLEALAEKDAPGGMHLCPECTYFQTSADLMIARYGYGLDRVLLDELEPRAERLLGQEVQRCLGPCPSRPHPPPMGPRW